MNSFLFRKDIESITRLCRKVGCNQQVTMCCIYLYKMYIFKHQHMSNNTLVISASVLLGCKIANYIININDLTNYKEEVINYEFEICKCIDFDFNIKDVYTKATECIEQYELSKTDAQYLWILINDSAYINTVFYDCEDLVFACMNLTFLILGINKKISTKKSVEVIMSQIVDLYENTWITT